MMRDTLHAGNALPVSSTRKPTGAHGTPASALIVRSEQCESFRQRRSAGTLSKADIVGLVVVVGI